MDKEAQNYVWEGAIPLQIHLHESEVTTVPPPSPALILAARIGYLPLLAPQIKPHFSNTLPPGTDTIWFEYKGLPLKWYIPTGVLFDLLCAEPERPWSLTVHFRGYPGNILTPCEGEESVKWSFINSLKEAAYVIHGSCKNIMSMSQPDQVELWRSVLNCNFEAYFRVTSKLKLRRIWDECSGKSNLLQLKSSQNMDNTDIAAQPKTGKIPVRLYVWSVNEDFDDLEDAPTIDSWDKISYINLPVEIQEGKSFTLYDAVKSLLPEYFPENSFNGEESSRLESESEQRGPTEELGENLCINVKTCYQDKDVKIKLVRIQEKGEYVLEVDNEWGEGERKNKREEKWDGVSCRRKLKLVRSTKLLRRCIFTTAKKPLDHKMLWAAFDSTTAHRLISKIYLRELYPGKQPHQNG